MSKSTSWIARHLILVSIIACLSLAVSELLAITTILQIYEYANNFSPEIKHKLRLNVAVAVTAFLVSIGLFTLIIKKGD